MIYLKSKIYVIACCFIFIFLFGCKNQRKHRYQDYYKLIGMVEDSLVSHFPLEFDYKMSLFTGEYPNSKMPDGMGLYLVNFNIEEVVIIPNEFKELDNNLQHNIYGFNPIQENVSKSIPAKNIIPMPRFPVLQKFLEKKCNGKLNNFKYYVNSSPGFFLESKYLYNSNGMPENWIHGMSRGIGVTEKDDMVIYWLYIW
jgi:hypothetical protein